MIEATPDDFVSLSRKFAEAKWTHASLVSKESLDGRLFADLEELGQIRLLHLDAILRELGPLSDGEHSALEAVALEFAKQHRKRTSRES